tara:strand:+ start:8625 stop:9815 length:1191 start_codon:yes stop_codon:yes gene_type:complete
MKKNTKDYLTVIVTIRNRRVTLGRILNYYRNHSPVKVIFLDSTDHDPADISDNMLGTVNEYRHVPGKNYVEKLRDCLRTIDTKYSIIVCDDDFLCFSGIPYSLQYLEENPDVVAVSGQEVAFVEPEITVCGEGLVTYETIDYLVDFVRPEVDTSDPKERIRDAWTYFDGGVVHGIIPTKILIQIQEFHLQNPDINAISFYDKTFIYFLAAKGKIVCLPTFHIARSQEYSSPSFISDPNAEETIGDWNPSLEFKEDFLKRDLSCLEELVDVDKSFIEEIHKNLTEGKIKEEFFKKMLKDLAIIKDHRTKIERYNVIPRFGTGANFIGDHGWQELFQYTNKPVEEMYPVMLPVSLDELGKMLFYIEKHPLVNREQLREFMAEEHAKELKKREYDYDAE